jgi:YegS/Rv2252/BmrU family lipid kinase
MTRYKLIVNPVSGRGAGKNSIPVIRELLKSHRLEFDLVETTRPWHAAELANQAARDGYDVVVAVGGDGTSNEVLNGLMQAKETAPASFHTTMGILSVGRGNDFAFGMNIPASLEAACTALALGPHRNVDVGRVSGGDYPQGRYFGNGVGIGFDAVVGFEAAKMKRLHGFANYIVAALKTIFLFFHAPQVKIESNDDSIQLSTLMISIMNGRRMGGGFMMAPNGLPSDGLLDVCIVEQVSRLRILKLISHFMKGTQATQKNIRTSRTSHLVVTAIQGSLPAHADGETICVAGQQLSIELLPRQIEMICQGSGEMR